MTIDPRRVQSQNDAPIGAGPVLYVVARDQRVNDNWALLYALREANAAKVPLLVLFALGPMFQHGSARHNEWMVKSLEELEVSLKEYQIPFFITMGEWQDTIPRFVAEHGVGQVVFDFNTLEPVRSWRDAVASVLSVKTVVVDAHNIIPVWEASPKAEFAAYTIRPKIHRLLREYLVRFPKMAAPDVPYQKPVPAIDWEAVRAFRQCDYSEVIPTKFTPGEQAATEQLRYFINHDLERYESLRNDPNENCTSHLSPYLRWGNIGAATVVFAIESSDASRATKDAFIEELVVRRELAENYCYYTKDYTRVEAAHPWAQETLKAHQHDTREFVYTYEEFRDAKTHDNLWNAAQRQMVQEGKMHGFMRMYWAKKILEWTQDPQTAIDIALTLNDRYELDGRDSNGVVGVMWSVAGVHDRAWTERPVFGKIRYMNYAGCKRKFDVKRFENTYGEGTKTETTLFS